MRLASSDFIAGAIAVEDDAMRLSSVFWSAFFAGMAGPAFLYGPTMPVFSPLRSTTVAQSFSVVGAYLDCTAGNYIYVGRAAETADSGADVTA